jgi:hypothetical protein
MLDSALPAGPKGRALLREIKDSLDGALNGKLVVGRSVRGLAKDGPIFLALAELPADPSDLPRALVLIARVRRYADFRDALLTEDERKNLKRRDGYETTTLADLEVFFVERPGYAVVALRQDLAQQFARAQRGLDSKLDKDTAERLLDADLSMYIDPVALGKQYAEPLAELRKALEEEITADGGPFGQVAKEQMKVFVQFLHDSRGVLLSAKAEPEGLKLHSQVLLTPGSPTARLLGKEEPDSLDEIGDLPASQASFSAVRPAKGEQWRALEWTLTRALAGRKSFKEAMELEAAAQTSLRLKAYRDRLGSDGITVSRCEAPDKMVASALTLYRNLKTGDPTDGALVLAEKPEVTADAQKHRGFTLHHVGLTYDLEKSAQTENISATFLRQQLGGNKGNVWLGTDGKLYVELHARSWRAAQNHLTTYLDRGDDRLGNNAGFQTSRPHFPEKVSWLILEETSILSQLILDAYAARFRKGRQMVPKPKPGSEAYWGVAFILCKERVSLDAWMPARVFNDFLTVQGLDR